jgi:hypothetical protein
MDLPAAATALLADAESLFVAVDSKRGPHVTPELFVEVGGRLWTFTAAETLKVRALRRTPRAGVLVRHGRDALVASVLVKVLDAVDPLSAATSGLAHDVPRVTAAFAARHSLELAGSAADYAAGSFGLVPGRRVLLAFEPAAVAFVRDDRLVEAGGWDGSFAGMPGNGDEDGIDEPEMDLDAIPSDARELLREPDAALGWCAASGPLALPARWSLDTSVAAVGAQLFAATGCVPDGPASLTIDEWLAPGPGGKRGVMLRGEGRATQDDANPDIIRVAVVADRAVVWDGMEVESVSGIRDFGDETRHTASVSDPYKDPKKETRAG